MKQHENLNTTVNNNQDKIFDAAYNLCVSDLTHNDIIRYLEEGNIYQKQIAALNFDKVNDKNDVLALISNLTGCDGKIREAVAYRIKQIISAADKNVISYFQELSPEILADAAVDINANICRMAIDTSVLLKDSDSFSSVYTDKIVRYALEAIEELGKFEFRDKKYVINKQLFKLYWCLEALTYFNSYADSSALRYIVEKSASNSEYTIREKTAQIVNISDKFNDIKEKLRIDENYYVRAVFLNH